MEVRFSKSFQKQIRRQPQQVRAAFNTRLTLFMEDVNNPRLRNHSLQGKYKGYQSINITGDVRALYTIQDNVVIIFGFIGTHSQLYK